MTKIIRSRLISNAEDPIAIEHEINVIIQNKEVKIMKANGWNLMRPDGCELLELLIKDLHYHLKHSENVALYDKELREMKEEAFQLARKALFSKKGYMFKYKQSEIFFGCFKAICSH